MTSSTSKATSIISTIVYITIVAVSIFSLFCVLYVLDQKEVGMWTSVNNIIFWATAFDLGVRNTLQHKLLSGETNELDTKEKGDITFTLLFFIMKNLILVLIPTTALLLTSDSEIFHELAPYIICFSLASALTHSTAIFIEVGRAKNKLFFVYYWSLGSTLIQFVMASSFILFDLSFQQFLSNYIIGYLIFFLVNLLIFYFNFYDKTPKRLSFSQSIRSLINPNYLVYSIGQLTLESGPIMLLAFSGNIAAVGLLAPWYRGFYLTSGFFKYLIFNVFLSRARLVAELLKRSAPDHISNVTPQKIILAFIGVFIFLSIISFSWVAFLDAVLNLLFEGRYNIDPMFKAAFFGFVWLAILEAVFQGTCLSQKMDSILRRAYGSAGLSLLIFFIFVPFDSVLSVLFAHVMALSILVLIMGAGLWKQR